MMPQPASSLVPEKPRLPAILYAPRRRLSSDMARWMALAGPLLRRALNHQGPDGRWEHCLLWLPVRPATKRIEDGDPGRLKIRYVARYYGEPVFERSGRDHEIGAVIAASGAQGAPTPSSS